MTQLIIDGLYLPEVKLGAYSAHREQLSQQVDMISGRRVQEQRGEVWHIDDSFEWLPDDIMRPLLVSLRKGTNIDCTFLPNDSNDMETSVFCVESMTTPTFACSLDGSAVWYNVAFSLREVQPHD